VIWATYKETQHLQSFSPAGRVVSDPASFKTTMYGISEGKPTNSDSTLKSDASLTKEKPTLSTEVLPVTHDVALPFQNSIERPQLVATHEATQIRQESEQNP
jgi:hypothetical protein